MELFSIRIRRTFQLVSTLFYLLFGLLLRLGNNLLIQIIGLPVGLMKDMESPSGWDYIVFTFGE